MIHFLIQESSTCKYNYAQLNSLKSDDSLVYVSLVHVTDETDKIIKALIEELGSNSKSYLKSSGGKGYAPNTWGSSSGNGKYSISSHIKPFLVDEHGYFTVEKSNNSHYPGFFCDKNILDEVESEIKELLGSKAVITSELPDFVSARRRLWR